MEKEIKDFTKNEMALFALAYGVMGNWATLWMEVKVGAKTKAEAYDEFNEYLQGLGLILAYMDLKKPGFLEELQDIVENPSEFMGELFKDFEGIDTSAGLV